MASASRWPVRLGWLPVIGSVGISVIAATGNASEGQLVDASLYVVIAFAAGVGLILGAWRGGKSGSVRDAWMTGMIVAMMCAAAAAYGRSYFLDNIFYG